MAALGADTAAAAAKVGTLHFRDPLTRRVLVVAKRVAARANNTSKVERAAITPATRSAG